MHAPEEIRGYLSGGPLCPPTGKKVWVKDTYVLTVRGDKVSNMGIRLPADGGIPAGLGKEGVEMPAM